MQRVQPPCPHPEQPSHITDEFSIAVRAFSDWGGQRGLKGKGGWRRRVRTDCDIVSLVLQQGGHAKNWRTTVSRISTRYLRITHQRTWGPPSQYGHHPTQPNPQTKENVPLNWDQQWEGGAPRLR